MSTLDAKHLKNVSTRILDECTLWLSRLFRMENASAHFDDDELQGLVRVLRLVLHSKIATFATDGYLALQQHQPVVYVNSACRSSLPLQLATQVSFILPRYVIPVSVMKFCVIAGILLLTARSSAHKHRHAAAPQQHTKDRRQSVRTAGCCGQECWQVASGAHCVCGNSTCWTRR